MIQRASLWTEWCLSRRFVYKYLAVGKETEQMQGSEWLAWAGPVPC